MQDKIAIILPVRDGGLGRHQRLIRCLESYYKQTENLSDIYLLHDKDECNIYHRIAKQNPKIINYCVPIGLTLMQKINTYALDIAKNYKYVGFIGDDIIFKTPFESTFIEYLSSVNYGMAYGNDLIWNGKLSTHPFITSNAILAVGFFGCPAVEHNYFDNYWFHMFLNLKSVKYFSNIVMEHMHPDVGKDKKDTISYSILNKLKSDSEKYKKYIDDNFDADLQKIKNYTYSVKRELR